jgi:hypothetical protein
MNETETHSWNTLAARLSLPPVKVMGRLLELFSYVPRTLRLAPKRLRPQ